MSKKNEPNKIKPELRSYIETLFRSGDTYVLEDISHRKQTGRLEDMEFEKEPIGKSKFNLKNITRRLGQTIFGFLICVLAFSYISNNI